MNTFATKISALLAGIVSAVALYIPTTYGAGAGTLADEPLFVTNGARPNVLFMVDDSGSMDAELITSDSGAFNSNWAGTMSVAASSRPQNLWGYLYTTNNAGNTFFTTANSGNAGGDIYVAPSQQAADNLSNTNARATLSGVWRARNPDYNLAYYNPAVTYEPWTGTRAGPGTSRIPFANANPTAALLDPFNPGAGSINLTANRTFDTRRPRENGESGGGAWVAMNNVTIYPATYWTWNRNGNGDNVVDANERGDPVEIISSRNSYPKAATRSDCAADTCTYQEEIQNFANWWQYHRRREYVMKDSMANVIAASTGTRMGIASINANVSAAQRQIAPMNDDPASGNKKDLLDSLFSVNSGGGTPLNKALRDAGNYFACSGQNPFGTSNCPVETTIPAGATEAAGVCQQNFTILLTDGAYTDENTITVAGNADGNNNTPFDGGPFADSESNTLADIAMHYYERDLHPGLANKVPGRCGVDQNEGQHMVTYTVSFGLDNSITIPLQPELNIAGQNCVSRPVTFTGWPSRQGGDFSNADKINELVHAAYNGRGQFYLARNSEQLAASLEQALTNINDRTRGTGSGASFNASSLGTDSRLYLAQFSSERWSGDVLAFDIVDQEDVNNDNSLRLGSVGAQVWSAAQVLDNTDWQNRRIWSHNGSATNRSAAINFDWNALSTEQQNDLRTNPLGTLDTNTIGQQRLDYLRGDRSREQRPGQSNSGPFRQRDSRLGDIIQSSAVFVGIPSLGWPNVAPFPEPDNAESYSEFRTRLSEIRRQPADTGPVVGITSRRTEMLYVGANDGMLHGFRASDGVEQFAYIPSYLFSATRDRGLHYLTDPTYSHRFGHDLTPTIADVYTPGAGGPSWKTVLVGGHRAGGRGFFALDVTNPSTFSSTNPVMWEFRGETGGIAGHSLGDPDLGFTFSKPTIVMTNTVKNGLNRWAAVFGNGYNQSGNGNAQLFIVFLDPDLSDGWTLNDDYIKIDTGSNGGIAPNGLSTPALVDLNGDGTVDRAYAGDLAGDMWAFDLCGVRGNDGRCPTTSPNLNWGVAHGSGASREPLFRGDRASGLPLKPITTQPQVIRNPRIRNTASNQPNLLVLFGSGRYISVGDNLNQQRQTFYGIWDAGQGLRNVSHLQAQTLASTPGADNRIVSDNFVNYLGQSGAVQYGWYLDLPVSGERSVTDAVVRNNIVFFATTIPSPNPCDAGGFGFLMFLDAANGGRPDLSVFDFNRDGLVNERDLLPFGGNNAVGGGIRLDQGLPSTPSFHGNTLYTAGTETATGGDIRTSEVAPLDSAREGRQSWSEVQEEFRESPVSQ